MGTPMRRGRMPSPVRHATRLGAWAAVLAALAVVVAPATPAAGADRREPPDVVGLTLAEAQARIVEEWYPGLRGFTPTIRVTPDPLPEQVPPDAVTVVDQAVVQYLEEPTVVSRVAVIDLTTGSVVADLGGRTRNEAQTLLDALGLSLKAAGTGLVDHQDPTAGTLVPFGTTVRAVLVPPATVTPTTSSRSDPTRPPSATTVPVDSAPTSWVGWPAGAALLAVVVLALWALRWRGSSRRAPRHPPAPPDVRAVPVADLAPVVSVHPQAADPELVVRVVPGADPGHLTLTEQPR